MLFISVFNNSFSQEVSIIRTSGNSWTIPSDADPSSITVECWGAGGGGASSSNSTTPGGGGGGGAYARKIFNFSPGQTLNYSIGVGGSSTNNDGGDTWFFANNSSGVKAKGGRGAANNDMNGAAGGAESTSIGSVKYSGGNGGKGSFSSGVFCGNEIASGGGGAGASTSSNGANGGNASTVTGTFWCWGNYSSAGNGGDNILFSGHTSKGGNGTANYGSGSDGVFGGGGGGSIANNNGGKGGNGLIRITYRKLYHATFEGISASPSTALSWCHGETRTVSIKVRNTGTRTWFANGSTSCSNSNLKVAASFKWNGDQDFDVYTQPPFSNRNPIPNNVSPGQSVTITFPVASPNGDPIGQNNLSINLIAQECQWFDPVVYVSPPIDINPKPVVNAGSDIETCSGNVELNGVNNSPLITPTYIWSGGPIVSGANTLTPIVNPSVNTVYTLTATSNGCSVTDDVLVTILPPPGNPSAFGDNIWNVYGYNGNNRDLSANDYRGFYEQPDLGGGNYGVDTEKFWRPDKSPEIAGAPVNTGNLWKGCDVSDNNHTFVHKRKGFPCGNYNFKFKNWDDETRLYIDGNPVWGCSTWDANGGANGGTSINAIYSCPTRDFTFALNADSEVEFQTFENSGNSDLGVVITKITPQTLASTAISDRTCPTRGADWVDFLDDDNKLIASINPNNRDLGNVTIKSYLSSPQVMKDCDIPSNTLYHTAYMGRSWVVVSDAYPSGADFNSDVSIRLPFTEAELADLNTTAQNTTTGNPLDGGTSNPVTPSNLMLTKITGPTENGVANQNDCVSTIRAVQSTGNGSYLSINNAKYVEFDIQQFSEFFLHKNNDGSALPVELTNFSASCDKQSISINWTTASELNSDYFVVEKSRDGQNWVFVAEQNAAGNSSEVINYHQLDENISGSLIYYRLRQVDFDGKEEVFGPISVSCDNEKSTNMMVFPNPNNGAFTLEVSSEKSFSDVQLTLSDLSGKVVFSEKVNIDSGKTQFYFNEIGLQKGVYLISLNGQQLSTKRIKVMID
ncbi:glycine-rich domain-containing protein [Brumimicrobium oceani]|uniref:glycine-rich domain-containing protein n=1 Tax=Brumimicrobium oceani TaxID=2100725 RepID=UPI0011B1F389|nr:T9SS type A sorting domain-containing protein [Brumimicrobium oceani]